MITLILKVMDDDLVNNLLVGGGKRPLVQGLSSWRSPKGAGPHREYS
jgi:hypothetical protein